MIAQTPKPPYYAVIFSSLRTNINQDYNKVSERMVCLAKNQEGFLGIESVRNKLGITVSYWQDLETIKNWKNNLEHSMARKKGREIWYKSFKIRICKVEKEYGFIKKMS